MAKLPYIEFANGMRIPILHEDRNVIAIDKPQGWMLAPVSWQSTGRNLFAALTSSVKAGDFWARSRNLKFIRFVHRLDADTSGVLLLVRAPGAMPAFTELFEDRKVEKVYLAVVKGEPEVMEWRCRLRIAPMQDQPGRMVINNAQGKDTETLFRVIDQRADRTLVMCWPLTGRTHQIRLHLAAVGHPVWGDDLYGAVPATGGEKAESKLALRAMRLSYKDPFMAEPVSIEADVAAFVKSHGFDSSNTTWRNTTAPAKALEHPKARLEELRREEKEQRKQQRALRHAGHGQSERREWAQREDPIRFASAKGERFGEESFRKLPPRRFGRGPRGESPFRHPRRFEGGAERGEFGRKPRKPGFGRAQGKAFGKKTFGEAREFPKSVASYGDRRYRNFGNRDERPRRDEPGGGSRDPFRGERRHERSREDRGERRAFRDKRGFGGQPGNAKEGRTGVFPSSAKSGLKPGFRRFDSPGGERRRFRTSSAGRGFQAPHQQRSFRSRGDNGSRGDGVRRGGFGRKPFPKFGDKKTGRGSKPASRRFNKF